MTNEKGQAVLEAVLAIPIGVGAVGCALALGWSQYRRLACMQNAFESTHAAMTGRPHFSVRQQGEHWKGVFQCGKLRERVVLIDYAEKKELSSFL